MRNVVYLLTLTTSNGFLKLYSFILFILNRCDTITIKRYFKEFVHWINQIFCFAPISKWACNKPKHKVRFTNVKLQQTNRKALKFGQDVFLWMISLDHSCSPLLMAVLYFSMYWECIQLKCTLFPCLLFLRQYLILQFSNIFLFVLLT